MTERGHEPGAPAARIDETTPLLRASDDARAMEAVVNENARRQRIGRWSLVAAAATTAAVLIAGSALVTRSGNDDSRTETAASSPDSTTVAPPSSIATPPTTVPGDDSTEGSLVPGGTPSTPQVGELVAHAGARYNGSYSLYADGRLIWIAQGMSIWVEQRLTPEGVERARSELLASGRFAPGELPSELCLDDFGACVRDGDRFLTLAANDPRVGRLLGVFRKLGQTLPATAWAYRPIQNYVPSRTAVCARAFDKQFDAPLDLSMLLQRIPARAAELLRGHEASAELLPLLSSTRAPLFEDRCFELALEEARALRDALLDPSAGGKHEYWGIVFRLTPPDPTQPDAVYVTFQQLLPDGMLAVYPG